MLCLTTSLSPVDFMHLGFSAILCLMKGLKSAPVEIYPTFPVITCSSYEITYYSVTDYGDSPSVNIFHIRREFGIPTDAISDAN